MLLQLVVEIKPFVSKGVRQCYRCQRFHHSSFVCNFAPRCVKCEYSHLAQDCTRPRSYPLTCRNYLLSHTANFSGCPKRPNGKKSTAPANLHSRKPGPPVTPIVNPAPLAVKTTVPSSTLSNHTPRVLALKAKRTQTKKIGGKRRRIEIPKVIPDPTAMDTAEVSSPVVAPTSTLSATMAPTVSAGTIASPISLQGGELKEITLLVAEIKEMSGSVGTLREILKRLRAFRGNDSDEEFGKFMRLMVDIRAELRTDKPLEDRQYYVHQVVEDCLFPGPN